MHSTIGLSVKARTPRHCRFALPIRKIRRSSNTIRLSNDNSRQKNTMKRSMVLLATITLLFWGLSRAPYRHADKVSTDHGSINHQRHQSHHRKLAVILFDHYVLIPCSSYGPYPYSVLRTRQASSNGFVPASTNTSMDAPLSSTRYASRIKIQSPSAIKIDSPSVAAAAKNAAAGATEDVVTDGTSPKSEGSTFVDKPRPGTSFIGDELVNSPTKSKL